MITCGAKNWSQLRIPNPSGQFAQRLLADSDVPTLGFGLALALLGTSESARRRCGVYIGDSPDVLKHNLVLSL